MGTFSEIRAKWETKYDQIAKLVTKGGVLVVLNNGGAGYRCHRYFPVDGDQSGDRWDVSVDVEDGSPDVAMRWLCEFGKLAAAAH